MKKFTFIGISIAIALGFAACQKEDAAPAEQNQESALVTDIFSASLDAPATRTATEDYGTTVTWAANDKVYYYSQDDGEVRNYEITAAGSSATITLEREQTDTYYNLVYAGNAEPTFSTNTDSQMTITNGVPAAQNGTFASANISAAHATPGAESITFKPVTALVKFTTARTDIKTITLTAGGSEKVAGDISVDPASDAHTATLSGDGSASITVTIASPAAGTYYINVLPATYSSGLVLTLKDASGSVIGTVTASKEIALNAGGKMINLGDIDSHIVAPPITGTAKAKLSTSSSTMTDVPWVQLWENGPKWATINVGVTSTTATGTAAYGGLYRWGGTNNMRSNTSASDDHYTGTTYDKNGNLTTNSDTATKLWGSNWRMPTQDELTKLKNDCTWSSFSAGYTITGKGDYSSNSIFLPAAGYFHYDYKEVNFAGTNGDYWSSTPSGSGNAYGLGFGSGVQDVSFDSRMHGCSVRAVLVD